MGIAIFTPGVEDRYTRSVKVQMPMAVVGTVHLLAFGFDTPGSLPPDVMDRVRRLHGHGVIRLLDALYVSRDMRGVFAPGHGTADLDVNSDPGSALWQLLDGTASEITWPAPLELQSSSEVGLDLAAVESLAHRIEPGTSALLILVEARWATDLLEKVIETGGFPIVFGCLEPETMLIVGPQLAAAAQARATAEVRRAAHGAATLDALATAPEVASTIAANVVRALVAASIIDPADVDDSTQALADAGLVTSTARLRRT